MIAEIVDKASLQFSLFFHSDYLKNFARHAVAGLEDAIGARAEIDRQIEVCLAAWIFVEFGETGQGLDAAVRLLHKPGA